MTAGDATTPSAADHAVPDRVMPDRSERFLALAGTPGTRWLQSHVDFFVSVLLLHLASREGVRYFESGETWRLTGAIVLGLCFAATFVPRLRVPAAGVALVMLTYKFFNRFPTNANHYFLEYLSVLIILIGYRPRTEAARLQTISQCMRWLLIIVFFWTGIRKLGCGMYFHGTYLAHATTTGSRARFFFGLLVPPEEYDRIVNTTYPGPYYFESALPLLMSNLVYLGEILIPLMMLTKRFRMTGFWLAFVSIVAIEVYARELMFGSLFTIMLLFFTEGRVASRLLPVFIAFYAFLLATAAGLLPQFAFN